MKLDFKFRGEDITLKFFIYNKGRIGILMIHKDTNNLWGPATVNIDNAPTKGNEIIIKNYHNNKGLYEELLEQKIVLPKRRDYAIGFETAVICNLTPEVESMIHVLKK